MAKSRPRESRYYGPSCVRMAWSPKYRKDNWD